MSAATRETFRARRERRIRAQAERVRDGFAAYADPTDVPRSVWDAAVTWSATAGGACYSDAFADVLDLVPDGWDVDAVADVFADAVDRYVDA